MNVARIAHVMFTAAQELASEHRPDNVPPYGCVLCAPGDGSWPCTASMVADDLRAVAGGLLDESMPTVVELLDAVRRELVGDDDADTLGAQLGTQLANVLRNAPRRRGAGSSPEPPG